MRGSHEAAGYLGIYGMWESSCTSPLVLLNQAWSRQESDVSLPERTPLTDHGAALH